MQTIRSTIQVAVEVFMTRGVMGSAIGLEVDAGTEALTLLCQALCFLSRTLFLIELIINPTVKIIPAQSNSEPHECFKRFTRK